MCRSFRAVSLLLVGCGPAMRIILTIPLCCPPTVPSTGIMCAGLTPCAPRFNLITCKERKLLFLRLRSGDNYNPSYSFMLSSDGSSAWTVFRVAAPCAPRFNLITCKERKLLFLRLRSGDEASPNGSILLSSDGSVGWNSVCWSYAVRPVLHRKFAKSGNFYFYGCGPALTVTPLLQVCCPPTVPSTGTGFLLPSPCAPRFIFYSLQKVFKARHICRTL